MKRFAIGDDVIIPVTVSAGRYDVPGVIAVRPLLHGPIYVSTADLVGDARLRTRVTGFRLMGGLVEVEAAIGGLRQALLVPRWAVRSVDSGPKSRKE
jgi:hypothetical protein